MSEKNPRFIAKPRLRELLKENKQFNSQKEFAVAVGVKEPTISRFDSQTRYDINTLASISRVLGVSIDDLFTIEENKKFVEQMYIHINSDNE